MKRIIGTAPTRVDLAGGTLDLWPIHHLLDHKATVNFAVTLPATVTMEVRTDNIINVRSEDQNIELKGTYEALLGTTSLPLFTSFLRHLWSKEFPGLTVTMSAKSPAGAGLGGSSCLAVTLASCFVAARNQIGTPTQMGDHELVESARDIEARLIAIPTGIQDYWGAVRGGLNVIKFPPGRPEIHTIQHGCGKELAESLTLVYSGKSRASAGNNWKIFKSFLDGEKRFHTIFNQIGALAEEMGTAIKTENFSEVLRLSSEEWRLRCELWPEIETDETKSISAAVKKVGAKLVRVCGAGGGGVMGVFSNPSERSAIAAAAKSAGGTVLDAGFSPAGLTVTLQ